jgi:uncharacterized protein YneF (UPF0154 family)
MISLMFLVRSQRTVVKIRLSFAMFGGPFVRMKQLQKQLHESL